jgi:hypothetical protein
MDKTPRYIQEWGNWTWKEAYKFPGSYQLGLGKKFLEQFEWNKFEPHPEWVEPHWDNSNRLGLYAAGIPGKIRVIYIPGLYLFDTKFALKDIKILNIEKGLKYIAYYFNPRSGKKLKEINVNPSDDSTWIISGGAIVSNPTMEDWVLVLEKNE